MSTSSSHLWQRPPGRLLRFAVPIAAVVGIAAAIAGALVPSAGRLALVPALFLLLFGVVGGIAISKFLFFILIVAAVVALFGVLSGRSA